MPHGLPHNPYFLGDLQPEARADAALPAAGAWDAAPTEFFTSGMDFARLALDYTPGAAGGAFEIAIEVSGESAGANWEQAAIYSPGIVAAGADTTSQVQREGLQYEAVGVGAEALTYGPLSLNGTVERMRIAARETGVVGTPGELSIQVFLS